MIVVLRSIHGIAEASQYLLGNTNGSATKSYGLKRSLDYVREREGDNALSGSLLFSCAQNEQLGAFVIAA